MSYPTTTRLYKLKVGWRKKIRRLKSRISSRIRYEAEVKKALVHEVGTKGDCLNEKNESQKSRYTVPLKCFMTVVLNYILKLLLIVVI